VSELTRRAASVNVSLMGLLRGLFWFALFIFFTFCFVVLFDYGTAGFSEGFQKEGRKYVTLVKSLVVKQADKTEKPKK
jgi:hypothetical protein